MSIAGIPTTPAGLSPESVAENYRRHYAADAVGDGDEYEYDFSGPADAPEPDLSPQEWKELLARRCPGLSVCAHRPTQYVYAGCPEGMLDDTPPWKATLYDLGVQTETVTAGTLRDLGAAVIEFYEERSAAGKKRQPSTPAAPEGGNGHQESSYLPTSRE